MYIYNVTINVDASIHDHWMKWMKEVHIPEVLATGKFTKAKMCLVMVNEEMGGTTYSVQYSAKNIETLHQYYKEDAQQLRDAGQKLFKDKYVAFRTELMVIDEQFSLSAKN